MNERIILRRGFLGGIGAAVVVGACGGDAGVDGTGTGTPTGGDGGDGGAGASGGMGQGGDGAGGGAGGEGGGPPLVCTPSSDNILGPYYREHAPFKTDLTDVGMPGTRITVSGRVLDPDCQPIPGALVDLWQADDEGDYDNDGVNDPPPNVFVLRGQQNADEDGSYEFKSIIPGHYLNGAQFRPAHIHVKVSAPGFVELTTQLYFEGDPYNDIDPWFLPELMLLLADVGDEKVSTFDFVLERV
jgi:protocatechuate 3,4-dioxygenase beta subunit